MSQGVLERLINKMTLSEMIKRQSEKKSSRCNLIKEKKIHWPVVVQAGVCRT